MHPRSRAFHVALYALSATAALGLAAAQSVTTFSVDWRSPTVGVPDSFTGTPITEGDVLCPTTLAPGGPQPQPGIVESGGFGFPAGLGLALHGGCVGHPGGTPCVVEVDALSHGIDSRVRPGSSSTTFARKYAFSVRFRGQGIPGSPLPPSVLSEGPCRDEGADAFVDLGLPPGPLPPFAVAPGNTGWIDGNALPSCSGFAYPGLGLIENPPGAPLGDNLDALDADLPDRVFPHVTATYFSLDAAFFDPLTGSFNTGSAAAHGFVGGDVLATPPGGAPFVYASAAVLGLDLFGAGTDDLDALALCENGANGFQPSRQPYQWLGGQTDMLFFSVRRASAVIGVPDSRFGIPIEPGDILMPPTMAGLPPQIWIAAENIGLATMRSLPVNFSDDLDALDTMHGPQTGQPFCLGDGSAGMCPCGNNGTTGRGCGNSVNPAGAVLWAFGQSSLANDTLLIQASGMPNVVPCLLFQGTAPIGPAPFGDGLRCVGGMVVRMGTRFTLFGNRDFGAGVPGEPPLSVQGAVGAPGIRYLQCWYRNSAVFCTPAAFNLSSGLQILWTP